MSHVEQAFMERRWVWLTKSVLEGTGSVCCVCCTAATIWECVGWYGWARLIYLICRSISCQETELQPEKKKVLYMKITCCNTILSQTGFAVGAGILRGRHDLPPPAPEGSLPLVLGWVFDTLPLVCLYSRKVTVLEKDEILPQMQCVYSGA